MGGKIMRNANGLIFSATLFAMPTSALADFQVCNKSSKERITVAVAHQDENSNWVSEGWWQTARGDCATVVVGNVRSQLFYVWGQSDGYVWGGKESQKGGTFCTKNEDFTLPKDLDCKKAGFEEHKFIEINTESFEGFVYNLYD